MKKEEGTKIYKQIQLPDLLHPPKYVITPFIAADDTADTVFTLNRPISINKHIKKYAKNHTLLIVYFLCCDDVRSPCTIGQSCRCFGLDVVSLFLPLPQFVPEGIVCSIVLPVKSVSDDYVHTRRVYAIPNIQWKRSGR